MSDNYRLVVVCTLAAWLAGCGAGKDQPPSATGDPEADRRAELRVGSDDSTSKAPAPTLYVRLGGDRAIMQFVDDFTDRVIADPRVNFGRENVKTSWLMRAKPWSASPENIADFKRHLAEFLALAAGGPAQYTGRPMHEVHKDMRISNAEFDAMVGDAKASLQRLGFGAREQRDLLAIFETTLKQVVERQ
jgi:hemoglobin